MVKPIIRDNVLEKIQSALSQKNYTQVLTLCSDVMQEYPQDQIPQTLYLFRSVCNMCLKKYKDVLEDTTRMLELSDENCVEDFVTGCWTMHTAALELSAKAYKAMGNVEAGAMLLKQRTELQQEQVKRLEDAAELKRQGDKHVHLKNFAAAVKRYEEAWALDDTDASIASNLSHVYVQMKEYEKALQAADECIRANPNWFKGYFRKGLVLLKMRKFQLSLQQLHTAMANTEDEIEKIEIQKLIMKVGDMNERQSSDEHKHWMGLLMALRQASWDFRSWNYQHKDQLKLSLETINPFLTHLSDEGLQRDIEEAARLQDPSYCREVSPKQFFHKLDALLWNKTDLDEYVCDQYPHLSIYFIWSLLKRQDHTRSWSAVFTMSSVILVCQKTFDVIDLFGDHYQKLLQLDSMHPIYTCDTLHRFLEFCRYFYASERRFNMLNIESPLIRHLNQNPELNVSRQSTKTNSPRNFSRLLNISKQWIYGTFVQAVAVALLSILSVWWLSHLWTDTEDILKN